MGSTGGTERKISPWICNKKREQKSVQVGLNLFSERGRTPFAVSKWERYVVIYRERVIKENTIEKGRRPEGQITCFRKGKKSGQGHKKKNQKKKKGVEDRYNNTRGRGSEAVRGKRETVYLQYTRRTMTRNPRETD